jgi:hypothetical protein
MAPPEGGNPGGGGFGSMLPLLASWCILTSSLFVHKLRRAKTSASFREALKKGIRCHHGLDPRQDLEYQERRYLEVEGLQRLKLEKSAIAMQAADSGKLEPVKQ